MPRTFLYFKSLKGYNEARFLPAEARPRTTMKKDGQVSRLSQILKWVGYLTAIFSLCATVFGVAKYLYGRAEMRKNLTALLVTEAEEQKLRDYSSAWQTLEKAAKLDPDSAKVRAAQEKLAMIWLEDIHIQEKQKFSDVTQKLEPILLRAVAAARPGPQQADLRAHIGWAYFLETRDGRFDLDPAGPYREAVAEDPKNPYAEAMWGHWILWDHCYGIKEAAPHFAAAIASQREGDFVRHLQLSALLNCNTEEADQEVIRVANAMRKEQRTLSDWERSHILGIYYFELAHQTAKSSAFINAVPPAEHVATFHWLFDVLDSDDSTNRWSRVYYLAVLQEAAGQRDEALANYKLLLSQTSPRTSTYWEAANAAVKRLSRAH
jgi:tetratricopeptide (TPR) repeat protein